MTQMRSELIRAQRCEKSKQVEFEGFGIDLFRTEEGKLGLTIEDVDGRCVDIIVFKDDDGHFKIVWG
jgi:hypothetical protein